MEGKKVPLLCLRVYLWGLEVTTNSKTQSCLVPHHFENMPFSGLLIRDLNVMSQLELRVELSSLQIFNFIHNFISCCIHSPQKWKVGALLLHQHQNLIRSYIDPFRNKRAQNALPVPCLMFLLD